MSTCSRPPLQVPSRVADDADGADATATFPFAQLGERTGCLLGLRPGNRLSSKPLWIYQRGTPRPTPAGSNVRQRQDRAQEAFGANEQRPRYPPLGDGRMMSFASVPGPHSLSSVRNTALSSRSLKVDTLHAKRRGSLALVSHSRACGSERARRLARRDRQRAGASAVRRRKGGSRVASRCRNGRVL
jgi:hypothetical protein